MRGIADDPNLIAACYPLHPTSLVVLPGLCSHYGQNERTLFSFLAGPEPGAVRSFMSSTAWSKPLPTVRLDQLYDYFLDNPSTVTAGAANASRWFEVATRIRDLHSLTPDEQRCLKVVGLINLVSQGGALRASHRILSWALVGTDGFADAADVHSVLNRLCNQGVLAYRSFADEFRVWQGSDFDFAGALTNARHRLTAEPCSAVISRALPLDPIVAPRHSQQRGTLRFFTRQFADKSSAGEAIGEDKGRADGLVVYCLDDEAADLLSQTISEVPLVIVRGGASGRLIELGWRQQRWLTLSKEVRRKLTIGSLDVNSANGWHKRAMS